MERKNLWTYMGKCTWSNCRKDAKRPQFTADGKRVWANLCDDHDADLRRRIDSGNVRSLMAGWINANGGAEKLAAKF